MSLKGSLETFALPEVLNLLADTSKSGELHVHGSHAEGRIWFEEGSVSGFAVLDSAEPSEAIFELLRNEAGEFEFRHGDGVAADARVTSADRREVGPEIERAEAQLAEWVEIVAVVPSMDHRVELVATAPSDRVTVDRAQWELLVAIAGGAAVKDVLAACQLREFEGCRAVKGLADMSLVEVFAAEPAVVETFEEETVATAEVPEPEVAAYVPEVTVYEAEEPNTLEPAAPFDALADENAAVIGDVESESVNPHYSDLWAAALEATQETAPSPAPWEAPVEDDPIAVSVPPADDLDSEQPDGRQALRALLAEVTSTTGAPESDESVDGLSDRGPWTHDELASFEQLGGWRDEDGGIVLHGSGGEQAEAPSTGTVVPIRPLSAYEATLRQSDEIAAAESHVSAEADVQVAEAEIEAEPPASEEPASEEPMNRGLLLKFLSSVRN